jgi:hypothetical protein
MENANRREPRTESLMDTGEAIAPLPRPPSGRHQALRIEAQRRKTTAKILVVCSSVVVMAVASLCYALLLQ